MSRWEWLINKSNLNIIEFNVETREPYMSDYRDFDYYVMSYVQSGEACAILDGERIEQPAGILMLIPPHCVHKHYVPEGKGPTSFLWWHFTITVGKLDVLRLVQFPMFTELKKPEAFEQIFYEYLQLREGPTSLSGIMYRKAKEFEIMGLLLESILCVMDSQKSFLEDIPNEFFDMMQNIIDHPEKNSSLQELADKYHLHSTYISNRFKKIFGISPMRLHNEVVVDYICSEMLKDKAPQITELANRLGFRDVSALTHFFTMKIGCSPTDYRKRNLTGRIG